MPVDTLSMVSSHEDRIQRLEEVTSELASSVAELNATMRAFSQQMGMMSDSVVSKLDDVSARLSDKIGNMAEVTKEVVVSTQKVEERVTVLESVDKKEESKSTFNRQVIMVVLSGAIGSLLPFLVQWLTKHV